MRTLYVLPVIFLVVLMVAGCQNDPNPVEPGMTVIGQPSALGQFMLPAGATLESANLAIYVRIVNGQTVNIHRITDPWVETEVTWDNFGAAFDAAIVNSFVAGSQQWYYTDITPLVQAWLDGDYPNYGLLLDQVDMNYPRATYYSRETGGYEPYIEICYTLESELVCEQVADIADAYIWQVNPTTNYGTEMLLYTGWLNETDLEKQSLLMFDIEYEPTTEGGCTRTIGFWGAWDGFGPQPDSVSQYLPQWLGNEGGTESIAVTNTTISSEIFDMAWDSPKNGIIKLYAQLLAAKLNFAAGADDSDVAGVVSDADDFLADHGFADWYSLSKADQKMVLGWMETLDDYNNGYIGPGHCDDDSYDDGEDDD